MSENELPITPIEIQYPGSILAICDQKTEPEKYRRLDGLTSRLSSLLAEAAAALLFFRQGLAIAQVSKEEWNRNRDAEIARSRELEAELEAKQGWPPPSAHAKTDDERRELQEKEWKEHLEIPARAARDVSREKWARGEVPQRVRHMAPYVAARDFLYCADMIGKIFGALAEEVQVVVPLKKAFDDDFPTLVALRDSVQHAEDRIRLRGKPKGGKATPLPNPNPRGGRLLVVDMLNGERFITTTADGGQEEIEISARTLERLRDHIQTLINTLPWSGPPHVAD